MFDNLEIISFNFDVNTSAEMLNSLNLKRLFLHKKQKLASALLVSC